MDYIIPVKLPVFYDNSSKGNILATLNDFNVKFTGTISYLYDISSN